MKKLMSLVTVVALSFSGCGSSGSTDDEDVQTVSGTFVDAPVQGLYYLCSGGDTGITDYLGTYTCNKDDIVTFKIGNLTLGSTNAGGIITPFHLKSDNENSEKPYNISQVLHSLDNDSNPDNNIVLEKDTIEQYDLSEIDLNVDEQTFLNDIASSAATNGFNTYGREQSKAKMLTYLDTNKINVNSYVDVQTELNAVENILCSSNQILNNGICEDNNQPITYSWNTSDWSDCSGECGTNNAIQTRTVVCQDSDNTNVEDSMCSDTKPISTQFCTFSECEDTINTIHHLKDKQINLYYKYSYDGAEWNTITSSLVNYNDDNTLISSSGYPIIACGDDTTNGVKSTIEENNTYNWEYMCIIIENEYTSYTNAVAFNIDNDGNIFGIFEKDTSSSSAILNLYSNYDGIVMGTIK